MAKITDIPYREPDAALKRIPAFDRPRPKNRGFRLPVGQGSPGYEGSPTPSNTEPVQPEHVQIEQVQTEPVHNVLVQPEPVQIQPVHFEPEQSEHVQNERIQIEQVQPEPVPSEPVHIEPVQSEPVTNAHVQNERGQFEPVTFKTELATEGAHFRLNLPETYRLLAELEGVELKVFLFLTIKAHGWDGEAQRVGDGSVRAARSYIAMGIGTSETSVFRALPVLIKKGLVRKSMTSCKTGNVYEVSPCLLNKERKPISVQNERVQKEPVQKEPPSASNLNRLARSNRTTNIDPRIIETLSLVFENLSVKGKERENALRALEEKIGEGEDQFLAAEILKYAFTAKEDFSPNPKPIISKLGFFQNPDCYRQVKEKLGAKYRAAEKRERERQAHEEQEKQKKQEEERQAEQAAMLEQSFADAFSEEKDSEHILSAYCEGSFGPLKDVRNPLGRAAALRKWGIERGLIQDGGAND